MHPVFIILLGIFLMIMFSGAYVFFVACRRGNELNWLVREELEKTPYGEFYENVIAADQWLKQHEVQDVYMRSYDGLRLHGLWIPAQDAKGTILLAHGYRSSYLLDFAMVFDVYHQFGFNLLVPDQRSHGKSEGKYITFGVKESRDMEDWIRFHNQHYGALPLILNGLSMGASTVMYLANQDLPDNVKGIIADCGFTSPKAILKNVYKSMIRLPAALPVWAADIFARIFAHFRLNEKDTRKTLANSRLPVLMIHGLADDFVSCEMTKQAYAACSSEKQLLLVAGAGHGVSFLSDPVGYTAAVIYFLKKHIENFTI